MNTNSIKAQLTLHVKNSMNSENPRFNLWYCGVTNNENRRKAEHNLKHGLVDIGNA